MAALHLINDLPIKESQNTKGDGLGFQNYAEVLGSAAIETSGPFTIGIFGEWGTGKTSLMRMIEGYVRDKEDISKVITVVWFNAWRYEKEEHPIVPLIATIVRELDKCKNKLQVFKDGGRALIRALRAVAYGFAVRSKVKVPGFHEIEASFVAKDMIDRYDRVSPDPLLDRSLYYEAFEELSKVNQDGKLKIVIIIDDLDRCFPDLAIKLLESIKLVLSQRGFVFILGVARSVIEGYLQYRYEKEYGLKDFKGQGYLDKIVQLPFHIPPHSGRMQEFSHLLIKQNNDPDTKTFSDILPIIAAASGGNPRSTIRFVNNLLIDKAISRTQKGLETIPIGYFAISRSLQHHWQNMFSLLISSDDLCTTIAGWEEGTLEELVVSENKDESDAAKKMISDYDLKELLFSTHGRNWLKNRKIRHGTIRFILEQPQEMTESIYSLEKNDIYICHNKNDVRFASKIAQFLNQNGVKVLMDIQLEPGEDIKKSIIATISNVESIAVLCGKKTYHHPWPIPDMEGLLSKASELGTVKIVPIMLQDCSPNIIPDFLKSYEHISLKDLGEISLAKSLRPLIKKGKIYSEIREI